MSGLTRTSKDIQDTRNRGLEKQQEMYKNPILNEKMKQWKATGEGKWKEDDGESIEDYTIRYHTKLREFDKELNEKPTGGRKKTRKSRRTRRTRRSRRTRKSRRRK